MKKSAKHKRYTQKDGRRLYEQDRACLMAHPKMKKIYDAEAVKKATALQLAEARLSEFERLYSERREEMQAALKK